jgi:hypothetical protein
MKMSKETETNARQQAHTDGERTNKSNQSFEGLDLAFVII